MRQPQSGYQVENNIQISIFFLLFDLFFVSFAQHLLRGSKIIKAEKMYASGVVHVYILTPVQLIV